MVFQTECATAPKPASDKTAKKRIKEEIVRQGPLRRDIVQYADGSTTQIWWNENPTMMLFENGGRISGMKGGYAGQQRYDASSFSWVSASTFVRKVSYGGRLCEYHEGIDADAIGGSPKKLRAWIDEKTRRPVALDNGYTTVTFVFSEQTAIAPLTPPAKFQEKLQSYREFYAPAKSAASPQ